MRIHDLLRLKPCLLLLQKNNFPEEQNDLQFIDLQFIDLHLICDLQCNLKPFIKPQLHFVDVVVMLLALTSIGPSLDMLTVTATNQELLSAVINGLSPTLAVSSQQDSIFPKLHSARARSCWSCNSNTFPSAKLLCSNVECVGGS